MSKRRPIVAANWKMHGDVATLTALADGIVTQTSEAANCDVVVAPPFPYLLPIGERLRGSAVALAAQDLSPHEPGAHTGDVAPSMLQECDCRYVIVGHSERRVHHGESDALVCQKATAALDAGLCPIVCIGETLEQRQAEQTESTLEAQLSGSLQGLEGRLSEMVLAYEPVWAIGTGLSATPEQAQQAHQFIREWLIAFAGPVAHQLRLQYGGSVKPDNAAELFSAPDIDGGLIGGAALVAASFAAIVNAASNS